MSKNLSASQINKIAEDVATANLTSQGVSSVKSEPTVDSEGHEALKITIVVKPKGLARLTSGSSLDTLIQIKTRLFNAGEERFPIIEYATAKELSQSGSS